MAAVLAVPPSISVAQARVQSAQAASVAIPGGRVTVAQRGARTVITLRIAATVRRLVLPKEDAIYAGAGPTVTLIGALPGQVLILRLDYASNPSGSAYQCGAGTETVLRVLALRPALHQTFSQRIASCWKNIDEGDLGWDARSRTLTVERTTVDQAQPGAPAADLRTYVTRWMRWAR